MIPRTSSQLKKRRPLPPRVATDRTGRRRPLLVHRRCERVGGGGGGRPGDRWGHVRQQRRLVDLVRRGHDGPRGGAGARRGRGEPVPGAGGQRAELSRVRHDDPVSVRRRRGLECHVVRVMRPTAPDVGSCAWQRRGSSSAPARPVVWLRPDSARSRIGRSCCSRPARTCVAGAVPPEIDGSDFLAALAVADRTFAELTATRTTLGPATPYARGRGVGGSSVVNAMVALRGDRARYRSWGWDDVDDAWSRVALSVELPGDDELGQYRHRTAGGGA